MPTEIVIHERGRTCGVKERATMQGEGCHERVGGARVVAKHWAWRRPPRVRSGHDRPVHPNDWWEMEMQRTDLKRDGWSRKRRDKAEMAWRHRSHSEKVLLKVIGFLVFALTCFIITVTIMDITYKAKIKDLENQLNHQETTASSSTLSTGSSHTSTLSSTLTSMSSIVSSTTTDAPTTSTAPPTTTAAPPTTTTTTQDTTTSTIPSTTETVTQTEPTSKSLLLEALQALLQNFSGTPSSDIIDVTQISKGVFKRTRGKFLIMADVVHEQSAATNPYSSTTEVTEQTETRTDDYFESDDEDLSSTHPTTREGSGVDEGEVTLPP